MEGFFSKQIERGERDNSGKRLFKGSEARTSKEKRKRGLGWCPVLRDRESGEKKTKQKEEKGFEEKMSKRETTRGLP